MLVPEHISHLQEHHSSMPISMVSFSGANISSSILGPIEDRQCHVFKTLRKKSKQARIDTLRGSSDVGN